MRAKVMLKITLIKSLPECSKFQSILIMHGLKAIPLFPNSQRRFKIEEEITNQVQEEIHNCNEVFDFIVRSTPELEDNPI
jgi:hypothetical protein